MSEDQRQLIEKAKQFQEIERSYAADLMKSGDIQREIDALNRAYTLSTEIKQLMAQCGVVSVVNPHIRKTLKEISSETTRTDSIRLRVILYKAFGELSGTTLEGGDVEIKMQALRK